MPEGIGYGEDSTEELIRLATDPMYNIADPSTIGALQQGVPQPGAMAAWCNPVDHNKLQDLCLKALRKDHLYLCNRWKLRCNV